MLLTFSCSDGDRIANEQCLLTLSLPCLPAKRENDDSSFSEDQLCAFLLDLHFAGTDTTANTILFALLYLMNYPQTQGMFTSHLSVITLLSHASGKISPPDWTISTTLNGLTGSNVVQTFVVPRWCILMSNLHQVKKYNYSSLWPNTCKANDISISLNHTLCWVLISRCWHTLTFN